MKHYPIPFNTEMVAAINEGRKTQTRRVVKPQPTNFVDDASHYLWPVPCVKNKNGLKESITCPYGQPGDVLWVREEHLITFSEDRKWITVEFKDGTVIKLYYKDLSLSLLRKLRRRRTIGRWQSARFLPKELCRIFLLVKSVKVERLKAITEPDAIAEGVQKEHLEFNPWMNYLNSIYQLGSAQESFESLWKSIYCSESWDANPWVWVVEFERITKEEAGL